MLAAQQLGDALDLVVAVVHAGHQRPLVLDRIAGLARITLTQFDQLLRRDARRARQQPCAQRGTRAVQRKRQRRPHLALAQREEALERALVADGREDDVLVADGALSAQQLDRFHHVVQVVRRLTHAHEDDLVDGSKRPQRARERHLRNDLGTAQLAQQAALPRHAEDTADRAADLGRHAQAAARQQHAFHGLAVGELDQQARRTVGRGVLRNEAGQRGKFVGKRRQRMAQRLRQVVLDLPAAAVLRTRLDPAAQHMRHVGGVGAERLQALADLFDAGAAHRPLPGKSMPSFRMAMARA